ncbi:MULTISPECIES: ROK family transcriptional regulator [Micromonospora]|uniref:ROK family transcriptional regulator n=1 Tax=Micromonospora sicca TaxID=2202420 RepID=A0A317DG10_9ACTN|nr:MULTISPECIES: ROK family transcriptional regulator [unclassified Micromonospora]MBM0224466.1 ROK family transcriptional regulator [Micromonospora sp. ATA51]MDZ5445957.1 ROK family transcriptional regulator [Micromonospora sp. 4G57]MDZ5492743.1 ROK family transcriptional regulator [Micromonospora sp. 4G53]PWR13537.1 sugar kinase [Micromonospora sp. 4G51]
MYPKADVVAPAVTAVFTAVLTEGPLSRVRLARRLGLSSAAVTKAARPLIEMGYLHELAATERTGPGAGRPASPLAVRADREFFVGVKITADELIGVVCDLCAQVRTAIHRPLTDPDVEAVLTELGHLVDELLDSPGGYRARTRRLGLAVSGDVDPTTGLVRYSPFLRWHNVPLRERAEKLTGLTVTVENDVKALTTAEHWFGEGVGAESFALVTVGTGIGCGLVIGGRLVSGSHGVAGEIGHIGIDANGPTCHCGGRGCVEAIAGTDAIVGQARQRSGRPELTFDEAVDLARRGDERVGAVFARAGNAIGCGIAAVANLVGPARIVVSGEGLAAYDLFETHIRAGFERQAFGAAAECPLSIRPLPFEEWARGAATVSIQALVAS